MAISATTTGKFARWKSGDHLFFFLFGLAIAQQQSCHLWSHAQHWPTIHLFWPSMNISTGFEMSRKKLHRKWPDREQTLPQVGRRLETSGFDLSRVTLQENLQQIGLMSLGTKLQYLYSTVLRTQGTMFLKKLWCNISEGVSTIWIGHNEVFLRLYQLFTVANLHYQVISW